MIHKLKIEPSYFQAVLEGSKTFEIRKNDRGFQKGDHVVLMEFDKNKIGGYTKREIQVQIKYVTNFNQKDDYVVFGFEIVPDIFGDLK